MAFFRRPETTRYPPRPTDVGLALATRDETYEKALIAMRRAMRDDLNREQREKASTGGAPDAFTEHETALS